MLWRTLTDHALTEMLPEPLDVIVLDVLAVNLDAAAVDVIEALQQLHDGALAAAAVTHQRRRLSVPHLQVQPVQHLPRHKRLLSNGVVHNTLFSDIYHVTVTAQRLLRI